jgi:hypothetical protein
MSVAGIQGTFSTPTIYQAEWPKSLEPSLLDRIWNVVWDVLCCTLLFPIGLARLALRVTHFIIIAQGVLPATFRHQKEEISPELRHTFKTPDGETLEGRFTPSKHPNNKDKVVIVCGGNGMHCKQAEKIHLLINSGASIFGVNPRGVGQSSGFPGTNGLSLQDSLALDAYSAYEYVRNTLNVDPEKIILHGLSLGGSYTTRAALLIEEKYGENAVKLINDSSFSTIAKVAIAHFQEAKKGTYGENLQLLTSWISDPLAETVINFGTYILGLQIDAAEAWNKLKTKKKCVLICKQDRIVPFSASLYFAIEKTSECQAIWNDQVHCCHHEDSLPFLNKFITTP